MNKVILIGRLGKYPDVKYTPAGDMVTTFSVATDESYKNREGEKVQTRTLYAKKIAEKKKQERENNKAIEEFLNNGGKITLCPPKIN